MTMLQLKVIVGSTRPGRASDLVTPWIVDRAQAHGAFEVELLDLRDWPLPMFTETMASIGDFRDPTYSEPIMRRWNQTIKTGDAFLLITPEYNHSFPAVLKNALDNVFMSQGLRNKPVGFVGYSAGPIAAARAVEHLAHVIIEADAVPLRNTVLVGGVNQAFVDGEPTAKGSDAALRIALDDLEWWGNALRAARAQGELPPGNARFRAAMA
jgi:NAD(P)H-dependent FMN reductase